ncbi:MAG: hypothetical protein H0T43_06705 [Solirubrobacterales bacterium]|nr:hypothetical protein [Solirubrobacterales bacterium]
MRRRHIVAVALAAALCTGSAVLVTGGAGAATRSQDLFRRTLLADERTTSAIKGLLRSRGGFVAPEVAFTDLTGDGRSDAVVLVETGGAAGAVALYVLSTHGAAEDSELRAVYRTQRLYRASAEPSAGALIVRAPRFDEGDDLCCPDKVIERVYAWSAGARTLRLRSSREVDGPAS